MTLSVKSQPSNTTAEAQVDTLLEQMTLAEKIGQMTQVEKNSISAADVTQYFIGSVLSGGGGNPTPNTPQAWARMVRGRWRRVKRPLAASHRSFFAYQ